MKLLNIIEALLGTAEEIVPVFIHNPKTQKLEGVIVTTANTVFQELGTGAAPATKPAA
jgi:hypothetical protein